jgi:hypothetical protein
MKIVDFNTWDGHVRTMMMLPIYLIKKEKIESNYIFLYPELVVKLEF